MWYAYIGTAPSQSTVRTAAGHHVLISVGENVTDKTPAVCRSSPLLPCFSKADTVMSLYHSSHHCQHKGFWERDQSRPSEQEACDSFTAKETANLQPAKGLPAILLAGAVLHLSASAVLLLSWLSDCAPSPWRCSLHGAGTPTSEPLPSQTVWLVQSSM